jgi:hypothetical protein
MEVKKGSYPETWLSQRKAPMMGMLVVKERVLDLWNSGFSKQMSSSWKLL